MVSLTLTQNSYCISITPIDDFDLQKTLECGQCFRAIKNGDKKYIVLAKGKVIEIEQIGNTICIYNSTVEDVREIWLDYFDLNQDYGIIYKQIKSFDRMAAVVDFSYGIHILKQELWEMITSFVLSCRNSISGVSKAINLLCENYGTPTEYEGKKYYSFPDISILRQISIVEFEKLKFGYRSKYLHYIYQNFPADYELNDISRELLISMPGIGNKVADCVMLHSGISRTVFPVDIWVARGLNTVFDFSESDYSKQSEFGKRMFGELSGYAEILLFYYSRMNKLC